MNIELDKIIETILNRYSSQNSQLEKEIAILTVQYEALEKENEILKKRIEDNENKTKNEHSAN